jgi:hypothetical protein
VSCRRGRSTGTTGMSGGCRPRETRGPYTRAIYGPRAGTTLTK